MRGRNERKPLRKRAEDAMRKGVMPRKVANWDLQHLIHELEIHEVELTVQNEELRNAQVELAASRDRYTDLYEFAPVAYLTIDMDGKVLQSNLAAAKMLAVTKQGLVRANLSKFVTNESQDNWYLHRRAAFLEEAAQVCEIRIRRRDGTELSVRAESIGFGSGKDRQIRMALVDITEREKVLALEQAARRELEAATRAKDRFLAMISHELRTPLTPILGWVKLLRNKTLKDIDVDNALEAIERNAGMQAKLIDDLLDISGNIAGKIRFKLEPVELSGIVSAAIETVRPDADAKGIQIQTQFDKEDCWVSGDSGRLQQATWNLLTNAIKFIPPRGNVAVRVKRAASNVHIIVRDTGEGIPEAFLPFLFDAFSQADDTGIKRRKGLGLGLAIVRQIVEAHGGAVHAMSTDGKGATFTIELPAHNEHIKADGSSKPARNSGVQPSRTEAHVNQYS